jgi:hypothetical protein
MKLNLIRVALVCSGWLAMYSHARAMEVTHTARVEIELTETDEKGKTRTVERRSGDLEIDWFSKSCKLFIRQDRYPCELDTSEDIINSKGELVVKSMPQLKFESRRIDTMLVALIVGDSYKIKNRTRFIDDMAAQRAPTFKVPFYHCLDCENNGKDLRLINAYYGEITRGFSMEHAELGRKKLGFKMNLKNMETVKGAFYGLIGNDNAAQYGQ